MRALVLFSVVVLLRVLTGLLHSDEPPRTVATTDPLSPAEELKKFHLPPGFEAQLVAAEPDIQKPINISFDDRGRLWVAGSVEYPFPASGRASRDKVMILEDFADNGRARKITTFADGLNIPIGILPLDDGALVYSIPNILRFFDPKNSGHSERKEVLYGTYGYRDTHGMTSHFTWGFDGWIYACHGYANTSTVKGSDGSAIKMNSGNTYRIKLDGTHVEQFTHGQVNPFGLAFDPLGNLFSSDCETKPIYQLLRGGWYPSFGKPDDGLGFAPAMMTHNHESTAIAGIVYYAADQFPPAYRDTVFVGNVVTNRINHDKLERHGSTYRALRQPDFLKSDDPWFRPVDMKLGPDGAIYVADFYNRIIGHYEVALDHPGRDRERGRIWRIVYRGTDGTANPPVPHQDMTAESAEELVRQLSDVNLMVRMKATNLLVDRKEAIVQTAVRSAMKPGSSAWSRVHGMWVLERRHELDDGLLASLANDSEAAVRVHAQRVMSERKTLPPPLHELALAGLKDRDAFVERAAADALGQHPDPANVVPLLELRRRVPADDDHLLYVTRMAIRNQFLRATTWGALPLSSWSDQDQSVIADIALGVATPEASVYLLNHFRRHPNDRTQIADRVRHIVRFSEARNPQAVVTLAKNNHPEDLGHQAALLRGISRGLQERAAPMGDEILDWAGNLVPELIGARDAPTVQTGIELAEMLKLRPARSILIKLAGDAQAVEAHRSAALRALLTIDPEGSVARLGRLLVDASAPAALRDQAAGLLGQSNREDARAQLVAALPTVPARMQNSIAVALAGTRVGAEKLLEAVAAGKASARLLLERPVEVRLGQSQLPDWKDRVAKLTVGLPPADQQLQSLLTRRRDSFNQAKADVKLGAVVFEKQCAICHTLGGKGAKIGPQLDGVGIRGLDRLLEDILDPNRNVDQQFRTTTLALKNGQVQTGLLLREEGEVLVLADTKGQEVRVPRDSVLEKNTTQMSPMPASLVDQIPEADFNNLMAFLLSQRASK